MRPLSLCLAVLAGLTLAVSSAAAGGRTVTLGMYVPASAFEGPSQRLAFATALADHLSAKVEGNTFVPKIYADASAFSAAAKRGEVQVALIDSTYAAARGLPFRAIAAATHVGSAQVSWQLVVGAGVTSMAELAGAVIAHPTIGAKDREFLEHALFANELGRSFATWSGAPNPSSAATMVGVGKAKAAVVPVGTKLPAGVRALLELESAPLPMLAVVGGLGNSEISAIASAALSFSRRDLIDGFKPPAEGRHGELVKRLASRKRSPVFASMKSSRLSVAPLLANRRFAIEPTEILRVARPVADDEGGGKTRR